MRNDALLYNICYFIKMTLKTIKHFPLSFLYLLIRMWPKKENIWVFSSYTGDVFKDNSKYLFLYVTNNFPNIKAIWISSNKELIRDLKEKGYTTYYKKSLIGKYYTAKSKFIFFDLTRNSVNPYFALGINVLLYHGLPVKKVSYDDIKRNKLERSIAKHILHSNGLKRLVLKVVAPYLFRIKPDYVLSTSDMVTEIYSKAFDVDKNQMLVAGYPRNDVLLKPVINMEIGMNISVLNKIRNYKNEGKKIIVYMPTWRDTGDEPLEKILDFQILEKELEQLNAFLIIKHHQGSLNTLFQSEDNEKIDVATLKNIIISNPKLDIYPLLSKTDLLITDYSSIFVDFLFLNRPIIFYSYDLKKFLEKDRDLYFEYESTVPGIIVKDFPALISAIKDIIVEKKDGYSEKRGLLLAKYFENYDGDSSKRLVELLSEKHNLKITNTRKK